jgi:hypothetical protein
MGRREKSDHRQRDDNQHTTTAKYNLKRKLIDK